MVVIDGAALAQMNLSKHRKTFDEYCESDLGEKLNEFLCL